MKFSIEMSADIDRRPRVSWRIREYFEQFVHDHILVPHRIIINNKWSIRLCISISSYRVTDVVQWHDPWMIDKPRISSTEQMKSYRIIYSIKKFEEAANPVRVFIDQLYESIVLFFTTVYKRIKSSELALLKKRINYDYLLSLPYPVPLDEQKYVGDERVPLYLRHYF